MPSAPPAGRLSVAKVEVVLRATPQPSVASPSATSASTAWLRAASRPRRTSLDTVRALRCLQLDPTAVVARNHLLVFFSRHGAFDERAFEQLAYEDRSLFEYWAHEASYVLAEDLLLHAWEMRHWPHDRGGVWQRRVNSWYGSETGLREHILEVLAAVGRPRATAFEDKARRGVGVRAAGRRAATSRGCWT